jgi:type IV pilus assembly protein PilF
MWRVGILLLVLAGCATEQTETESKREYTQTEKARFLIQIANGALIEGDSVGALQQLAKAELQDDQLPELHHTRALAYFTRHDLDQALISARKAVQLKPNYSDANNTLGRLLIEVGKYDEAQAPLKVAAGDPLYRESFKAWTNLGMMSYRVADYEQSGAYFNKAVLDSPNQACIAYYYLGHLDLRKKKLNEAIENYSKATKKFCAFLGDAHFALGLAYEQGKQFEMARKTFLEIQKRYPHTKLAEQAIEQLKYLP